jgi:sterol 24-C-methyltransferase
MRIEEYLTLMQDPEARAERYADLVPAYFDIATSYYRDGWSDSFHFAWFTGQETLVEAQKAMEEWMADTLGLRPGMRVVDVGCGIGGPATTVASHSGAHVVGVNITPLHVEIARQRPAPSAGSVEFMEGDAQALPLPDEDFDAGYWMEAIAHAPDKAKCCHEMARVLKSGAPVVGCEWLVKDGLTPDEHEKWIEPIEQTCMLSNLLSPEEMRAALVDAGFTVQEMTRYQDHGDVTPNWSVPQAILPRPHDQPGEQEVLHETLEFLRQAIEGGYMIFGRFVATKAT